MAAEHPIDAPGEVEGGPAAPTSALYRMATALEGQTALDRPAAVFEGVATTVLADDRVRAFFSGRWLGHALHPLLTDLPLGSWMSATLLDLLGGPTAKVPARRLVAVGLAAAAPTALAGWSDWLSATQEQRRVGAVHAVANTVAVTLYAGSLLARYRGRTGQGAVLGLAGGAMAIGGGYLGGHLSCARDTALRASRDTALRATRASVDEPPAVDSVP